MILRVIYSMNLTKDNIYYFKNFEHSTLQGAILAYSVPRVLALLALLAPTERRRLQRL